MSGLDAAAAGVAGLAARATLVLCLALALAWLARRGSARTLHLLWTTTFVVLLALPVLSLLGPSWTVPILPVGGVGAEGPSFEMAAQEAPAAGVAPGMRGSTTSFGSPRRIEGSMASSGSGTLASRAAGPGTSDEPIPVTPAGIAFLIWALGCVATLTSLGVGGLRFRTLVRKAVPVRNPAWLQQVRSVRRRLRVGDEVRVLMSSSVATAMAGGAWRPVILLPSAAEGWSPERRGVVLAHELVHARRRDALREVVGRAAVALYWFHPLSWLAWRAATIAAERSCDEEVLALGTRPSAYARHLFSLASETKNGPAVLALPMAQRSQLENRIMSILKQDRPRYSLARTTAALAGISVAGTLIACANPVPGDSAAQPAPHMEETASAEAQPQERMIPAPSPEPMAGADPVPEPASPGNAVPEPTTPETAVPEPQAAAPAMSEPEPAAPPTADATPDEPESIEPAPDRVAPPAAISLQELDCNLWSVREMRDGGSTTVQTTVDGMQLCMRSRGDVVMIESGTTLESMDAASWLVLQAKAERLHRMVITSGPGGLEYDWSIDGRPQPFDAEAREWRDLMFTVLARSGESQQIRGREASLRGKIASHRGWVATLQGRIASHRWHVATLEGQIASLRAHVAGLHAQMASARVRAIRLQGPLAAVWQAAERVYRVDRIDVRGATRSLDDVDWSRAFGRAGQVPEATAVREALNGLSQSVQRLRESLETLDEVYRDSTQRVEDDLEVRLAELAGRIEEYDLAGRVAAIEAQIEEYDLDGRIAEIESQIEEYDLDGKIREIETQIEELDADRRADDIERSIQDEIAALRRMIG